MITRRQFIAIGAYLLTVPLDAISQQPNKLWRIGFLSPFPSNNDVQFEEFKPRLRELGHVEGKTITIDYVSAEGKYERLPTLAAELVRRKVDIILAAGGTPSATAAKDATRTIPIVFVGVADPVGQQLVTNLARPGGNVTGMSSQQRETAVKYLALLKEIDPGAKRIAVLSNPSNSSLPSVIREMQKAAKTLQLEMSVVNAATPGDFERAFAEIAKIRPAGVAIVTDTLFNSQAARLATLAAKYQLATMGGTSATPDNGGLMSYGANRPDLIRRATILVDKILKGAKPGDLPVEQPTKIELVINLKTAKALGITVPQSILLRADKVIE